MLKIGSTFNFEPRRYEILRKWALLQLSDATLITDLDQVKGFTEEVMDTLTGKIYGFQNY